MTEQTPALILFNQIKTMDPTALIAWGAKNLTQTDNGQTLQFKTSGLVKWKGFVSIAYDQGMDLYNLKFFRVRSPRKTKNNPFPIPEIKVDKECEGVYTDSLIDIINRQVG